MIYVFTDGGARGNPGPAAIGVFITDEKKKVLFRFGKPIGIATNNVAEYRAVLAALSWLLENKEIVSKHKKIFFFLDSLLITSQINGLFKVKNTSLIELLFSVREKEAKIKNPITYSHVPREKNKDADALVNMALDKDAVIELHEA